MSHRQDARDEANNQELLEARNTVREQAAKLIRVRLITQDLAEQVKARRNDLMPVGMHVPYMGPFSSAVPSVLRDLDGLVRDLTEATDGEECADE
jgi:hypothetical protein